MPFNVSCGTCFMCRQGLHSQCETTQVHEHGMGASLFGYTKLYGQVPGGQAEYLRVPFGNDLPVKVPDGPPDDRFVYLSDVLPTAWQAVQYAAVPPGGSLAVLGLGPIGDMCTRVAAHLGVETVIGIDLVPERLDRARRRGVRVFDLDQDDLVAAVRDLTDGRGPDAVIDAVGLEAHGAPVAAGAPRHRRRTPCSRRNRTAPSRAVHPLTGGDGHGHEPYVRHVRRCPVISRAANVGERQETCGLSGAGATLVRRRVRERLPDARSTPAAPPVVRPPRGTRLSVHGRADSFHRPAHTSSTVRPTRRRGPSL